MWIKDEDGALLNLDFVREIMLKNDSDPRGGTSWRVLASGDEGIRLLQAFSYTDKASSDAAHHKAVALYHAIEASLTKCGALIEMGPYRTAKTSLG